jgi:hypothetical protein
MEGKMRRALRLWLLTAGLAIASSGHAQDVPLEHINTQTVHVASDEFGICLAIALTPPFRKSLRAGITKVDLPDENRMLLTAQPRDDNEPPLWQLQLTAIDKATTELALYVPQQVTGSESGAAEDLAPFIANCIKQKPPRGVASRMPNPAKALLGCWQKNSFNKRARSASSVTFCFRPHEEMVGISFDTEDGWDWPERWKMHGKENKITVAGHTCTLGYHREPKAIALTECGLAGAYDWQGPYRRR